MDATGKIDGHYKIITRWHSIIVQRCEIQLNYTYHIRSYRTPLLIRTPFRLEHHFTGIFTFKNPDFSKNLNIIPLWTSQKSIERRRSIAVDMVFFFVKPKLSYLDLSLSTTIFPGKNLSVCPSFIPEPKRNIQQCHLLSILDVL